ncbi:TPA: hypothetical protein I7704_21960 [Vibrio vulnificus]|nr:hypothetical protein [Vibrio vulnificus]HAS8367092.1 hypothetical protein [Vibrio vulnificus]
MSCSNKANKAFKSDSQRLAVSLRSSIAKRRSHLNAALAIYWRIYANTFFCRSRIDSGNIS